LNTTMLINNSDLESELKLEEHNDVNSDLESELKLEEVEHNDVN
jgi:hypothetical protein